MEPCLSVIIPTFNRSHLLSQAINSVLRQTHRNVEVLVVDDGSSDNTEQIAKNHGPKVKYLFQNHGGLNLARNRAMSEARGAYIALLDDDDLWLPWKTEVQIALLERYPEAAYIFTDFYIFSEYRAPVPKGLYTWFSGDIDWHTLPCTLLDNSASIFHTLPAYKSSRLFSCRLYEPLLLAPYVLPSTAIFRRSMVPCPDPFPVDNTHCGDWAFFAMLSKKYPCLYLDVETTLNRSHDDQVRLTRKSPVEKLKDRVDLIERVWEADNLFMADKERLVGNAKYKELTNLCLNLLYEGKQIDAKKLIDRYTIPHHYKKYRLAFMLLNTFANLHKGGRLLRILRDLKHHMQI